MALAGDGDSESSCSSANRASSSRARASSLRSASTASSSSFLICCNVPSRLFRCNSSRAAAVGLRGQPVGPGHVLHSAPKHLLQRPPGRRSLHDVAPDLLQRLAQFDRGASGSGPPLYREYRVRRLDLGSAIDSFALAGNLVDTLGQIKGLQRQFHRGSPLTVGLGAQPLRDGSMTAGPAAPPARPWPTPARRW